MHGAALAMGITMAPSGQLRHHAFGIHAASQHMAMISVGGDHLITFLQVHLHPNDHGFLSNIKVAKSTNQFHAIELSGFLLEAPDPQHFPKTVDFLFPGEFGHNVF